VTSSRSEVVEPGDQKQMWFLSNDAASIPQALRPTPLGRHHTGVQWADLYSDGSSGPTAHFGRLCVGFGRCRQLGESGEGSVKLILREDLGTQDLTVVNNGEMDTELVRSPSTEVERPIATSAHATRRTPSVDRLGQPHWGHVRMENLLLEHSCLVHVWVTERPMIDMHVVGDPSRRGASTRHVTSGERDHW
jgi:hypothetical protein